MPKGNTMDRTVPAGAAYHSQDGGSNVGMIGN